MSTYILVVDDEPDAREILVRIVKTLGLDAKTASDGFEAIEEIKTELPALVLLDLMMPGMDGFDVLNKMRADMRTRYIPVVVVTACSSSQVHHLQLPGVALRVNHEDVFVTCVLQRRNF